MPKRYDLSPNAAAERLCVSVDSVRRWAAEGTLPALKTPGGWWRFSETDLDEFIAAHMNQPATEASA